MKKEIWSQALTIMAKLTGWIAFPVIIATFVGQWLDGRYGTGPWLFLASIGVSFIVSMYGLTTNALNEFKKIEKEYDKDKENKNKLIKK